MIGIVDRRGAAEAQDILPRSVQRRAPSFERRIWGTFHVCPLTHERAGRMTMAYLDSARDLIPLEDER